MEQEKLQCIMNSLNKVAEVATDDYHAQGDHHIIFEVLQLSDLRYDKGIISKIESFYDENWTGNRDFLHVPTTKMIENNLLNYPILVARERGKGEILAISTIKHNQNKGQDIDPYFPEEEAEYFSITGILAKKDCPYRGLGKKMYEVGMMGVYGYNKQNPGARLIVEIDCRNVPSFEAAKSAARNINERFFTKDGKELSTNIAAYYTLQDEKGKVLEAPTFILEIGTQASEIGESQPTVISFSREERICTTVEKFFEGTKLGDPIVNLDDEIGNVHFFPVEGSCNFRNIRIEPNRTQEGNDRVPRKDSEVSR